MAFSARNFSIKYTPSTSLTIHRHRQPETIRSHFKYTPRAFEIHAEDQNLLYGMYPGFFHDSDPVLRQTGTSCKMSK